LKAFVLALLLAAAAVGAVYAESKRWNAIEYYYKPEALSSLNGRIYSLESLSAGTHRPQGVLHFIHGEYGDPAFSEQPSWPVSDYTGLPPGEPADARQGANAQCSAFQVQAGKGLDTGSSGWLMKTSCSPLHDDPAHRFVNMQANIAWTQERMPRPWQTEESRFGFEFSLKLPTARVLFGAKGYATAQVQIDDGDGHFFWLQPLLFLAGFPAGAERTDDRGFIADVPYINAAYRSRGRYMSKFDNPLTRQVSHITSAKPWPAWHWYAFTVSRAQLQAAVTDLNANGGKFSTDLSRYGVGLIGVQTEINRQAVTPGKTPEGWIGVGLKQLYAYRLY
jgi:hypothetical protein